MPAYIRSLQDLTMTPHMSEEHLSLPDKFLLGAARSVLCGLAVLHSAGIAHCDVKADNIMFDGVGNATLSDLGAATKFGDLVMEGIPSDMSLGVSVDRGDATVDLASLAVTLWWAAYGYSELGCCSVGELRDRATSEATLGDRRVVAAAVAAILTAGASTDALESITALMSRDW